MIKSTRFVVHFCLLLSALCLLGCGGEKKARTQETVPVMVAVAEQKNVPIEIHAIGSVQPMQTVAVHAQVTGLLTHVSFREGDDVARGQLLFTIDQRPYQAALAVAQANLARDEADLRNAEAEAKRYGDLVKKDYVTKEEYDKIIASAEAARAVAAADKAAIDTARVGLSYCQIRSPLAGRTGSLQVHAGNLVRANDTTPLVIINQIAPVYVQFAIPERDLNALRKHADPRSVPVRVTPREGGASLAEGRLTFIDNAVDPTTGTISLKGTFANPSRTLWPGQFVNVAMTVSSRNAAVVIPAQAVQTGQRGQYVYVVTQGNAVEMRPVTVGQQVEQQAIIDRGVQPGETVVTDGQIRLTPKSKVEVKTSL
jgi:multidrug efflux system membrane fusion protein